MVLQNCSANLASSLISASKTWRPSAWNDRWEAAEELRMLNKLGGGLGSLGVRLREDCSCACFVCNGLRAGIAGGFDFEAARGHGKGIDGGGGIERMVGERERRLGSAEAGMDGCGIVSTNGESGDETTEDASVKDSIDEPISVSSPDVPLQGHSSDEDEACLLKVAMSGAV